MRFPLCVVLSVLLAAAAAGAAPKFRSVWKTPEVSKLNFASKKIAALVITDDQSLQMSGEEALAKELNNLGVSAVTTYRFVPREEMRSAERARPWFEKSAVEGVVAARPRHGEALHRLAAGVARHCRGAPGGRAAGDSREDGQRRQPAPDPRPAATAPDSAAEQDRPRAGAGRRVTGSPPSHPSR